MKFLSGTLRYLSLDIGKRHTGVAYADSRVGIALPLDTIHHETDEGLIEAVRVLVEKRGIGTIIVGLPVLLSGKETSQTDYVRSVAEKIEEACPSCALEFVDERETNKIFHAIKSNDLHAQAAVMLLRVFLEREEKRDG